MPTLDQADVAVLAVVAFISFGFYARAWFTLRVDRRKVQKYKFYKVRDDLIYLVASGQIDESDQVFQYFYNAITFVIRHTQVLTLGSLVKALEEARETGLDPTRDELLEMLNRELPTRSQDTQRVVAEFYQAVLATFLENSLLLRELAKHDWLAGVVRKMRAWASAVTEQPPLVYFFYRKYQRAVSRTSRGDNLAIA